MADIFQQIDALQQEINQFLPLQPVLLNNIKEYYRIGLTYTSNAIEGNSLTETETKIVLEEGITIGGKRLVEHLEAIGHSDAYNFMYTCLNKKDFSQDDIKHFHRLFYYRIDEKYAGIYRTMRAFITGSKYPLPDPQEIPDLMNSLIETLAEKRVSLHPVVFAAQAHKDFVFIHPFVDGNGRVARLIMNLALLQAGYTITIIPPIVRTEYIRALEKAHVNDHDFINFIAHMVKETQQDYLRLFCHAKN